MTNASRRPIRLLVNPAAGGKPGSPGAEREPASTDPAALAERLRGRGLRVELTVLRAEDDLPALSKAAERDGFDVVAAGGDGTVRPVAEGLLGTEATLGILPLGSFNNIARGAGLPLDLDEAIDRIVAGRRRILDVGLAWPLERVPAPGATPAPPPDATPFFEAAGAGLDADAFGAARIGERRGPWFALRAAVRAMRRRGTPVGLTLDDERLRVASPSIVVCNGPYHGMGFSLAPDADPADGVLDVVVFSHMSRLSVVRHYLRVARGRRRPEPRVEIRRATTVVIDGERRRLPAHADGVALGRTPVAVTCRHAALRLFA